jgi:hypothetical protein
LGIAPGHRSGICSIAATGCHGVGGDRFDTRADPTITRRLANRLKALSYDVQLQP